MTDIKSHEARSRNMAAIHGKDTKPEIYLRKLLFAHGYRYRKNYSKIPGHPDIYLSKYHTAIFVNGCFWHRHDGCKYAYMPKSNTAFWERKFQQNKERDSRVQKALAEHNIKCLIVWECTIKQAMRSDDKSERLFYDVKTFLYSDKLFDEI